MFIGLGLGLSQARSAVSGGSDTPPVVTLSGLTDGVARIGTVITARVDDEDATDGTVTWRAGAQVISGAVNAAYTVDAAFDGADLSAEVEGVQSEGAPIAYAAPTVIGSIANQTLATATGTVTIDLTTVFSGGGLSYTVEPVDAPVSFDGNNALISTASAYASGTVIISALNSGGEEGVGFTLEIDQGDNQVVDFGLNTDTQHVTKVFTTPLITQAELIATDTNAPETGIALTADGLAFSIWWNGFGLGGSTLFGVSEDNNDYISFSTGQLQLQRGGVTQQTTARAALTDTYAWHLVTASIRRRGDNGNAWLRHWRDGEVAVNGTSGGILTDRLHLMLSAALGRFQLGVGSYAQGRAFDFAVMRGEPDAAHAWAWNNGTPRSLENYDFANDPNCKLVGLFRLKRISPGNNDFTASTDMVNIIEAGDPRLGPFSPIDVGGWTEVGTMRFDDIAPWQVTSRLVITAEPSISESGGVFTVSNGTINAVPAATIERTAFWNGVEVALTGNTYTRPAGQAGQFACYWKISNTEGTHEYVKDDKTYLPDMDAGSGDAARVGWLTNGIAHDGVLFRWPDQDPCLAAYWPTHGVMLNAERNVSHYPPATASPDRNGAMKNILFTKTRNTVGYGGGGLASFYDQSKNIARLGPYPVAFGDCVIAARTNWNGVGQGNQLLGFVTLHCVETMPFWDQFKFPHVGPLRPVLRMSDVDPADVASLDRTGMTNASPGGWDQVRLTRPVLEIQSASERAQTFFDRGAAHVYTYGDDRGNAFVGAYNIISTDTMTFAQKMAGPLGYLLQYGIDTGYAVRDFLNRNPGGRAFETNGGWNNGMETAIALGGHLLGDTTLTSLVRDNYFHDSEVTFYAFEGAVTASNKTIWPAPHVSFTSRAGQPDQDDFWYPFPRSAPSNQNRPTTRNAPFTAGMVDSGRYPTPFMFRDVGSNWPRDTTAYWNAHPYEPQNNQRRIEEALVRLAFDLGQYFRDDGWLDWHLRYVVVHQGGVDPWIARGGLTPASYTAVAGTPSVNTSLASNFALELRRKHFPDADLYPWVAGSAAYRAV